MRALGLAIPILLATLPVEAAPPGGSYRAALAARCEGKRLDWLNPGLLFDGLDAWQAALPAAERAAMGRAAKPALARCEHGAGCPAAATIRAAEARGLAQSLAAAVCALPYRCTAPFTCR